MTARAGGCLCGAVRYEVDPAGAFDAGYCHCSLCRRASGAPVLAWALVRRNAFRLLSGSLSHYHSSEACCRSFCPACGSQLFYEMPNEPGMIGVHVATLDDPAPPPLRPRLHMFADDQLPWFSLRDDLPRFVDNELPHPGLRFASPGTMAGRPAMDVVMSRSEQAVMPAHTRWVQLLLGLICMMAISSPQYVWTLFTKSWGAELGAAPAAIQVTFSLLVVLQTFFSPAQGYLIDRFGPRLLIATGVVLTGLSWVVASGAATLTGLYLAYGVLGGLGTGIVYVGVVGLMVRWFPDRRGFAAGLVAAGYGMGAIVTTFPISASIAASGFRHTLLVFGLGFGAVGAVAALGLRTPPAAPVRHAASVRDTPTATMLRTPLFWLMFAMMALMSTSGLMVTSQIATLAGDYGVSGTFVFGLAALPLALTLDRCTNGLTRPFFGWLSDLIGRENTMFLAFGLEGLAMTAWMLTLHDPVAFVLLSGLVFFGWGEIFSLFPSTLTDTFGTRSATTNYGCLYIAQGVGSILGGPMASLLHAQTGSWGPVFGLAIGADLLTAVLALAALRPMRQRWLAARLPFAA